MSDYRKNLVERMIRLYGSNDARVVAFIDIAKEHLNNSYWDRTLLVLVESHELYLAEEE